MVSWFIYLFPSMLRYCLWNWYLLANVFIIHNFECEYTTNVQVRRLRLNKISILHNNKPRFFKKKWGILFSRNRLIPVFLKNLTG